jgi:hypothetical protein
MLRRSICPANERMLTPTGAGTSYCRKIVTISIARRV